MADENKNATAALLELLVSSLTQVDALSELLIAKGIITKEEFLAKIPDDRAKYQAMLRLKQ
jgi:hypothetical protein